MRKTFHILFNAIAIALLLAACGSTKKTDSEITTQEKLGPDFIADSAMAYCKAQCDFGPRTMNSKAHDLCEEWIVAKFKQFGTEVSTQKTDIKAWDGTMLHSTNIIARYNPEATRRILLCAHWDSRPWADNDPDSTKWKTPVLAANDGASGVAVMLEIARLLQADTSVVIGVDFVCFDAEDYGTPQWAETPGVDNSDTWALGSQHWAKQYQASLADESTKTPVYEYGILLDMVGGQGAHFYYEGFSMRYAAGIVDKVWTAASTVGKKDYFISEEGKFITDDHDPINNVGIPTIDIISYYPKCEQSIFGPTWHTVIDDMEHIDPAVLHAVGQTLIQVIYQE